jgi:intracellular septation protein
VLGRQLSLTNKGWKVLTLTWVAMALAWASTNEIVWRLFSTDNWIAYKTFNDIPILLGYIIATRALAGRFWKVQSYPET